MIELIISYKIDPNPYIDNIFEYIFLEDEYYIIKKIDYNQKEI
jgi:hypothetical protein